MDKPSDPIAIPPVTLDNALPFWSVMIPTYNPRRDYLEQALSSVLSQDPGQDKMQIEVVDDCSTGQDVANLVWSIAGDRVTFSKTPSNLGLAGCWNACAERSINTGCTFCTRTITFLPDSMSGLRVSQALRAKLDSLLRDHSWWTRMES